MDVKEIDLDKDNISFITINEEFLNDSGFIINSVIKKYISDSQLMVDYGELCFCLYKIQDSQLNINNLVHIFSNSLENFDEITINIYYNNGNYLTLFCYVTDVTIDDFGGYSHFVKICNYIIGNKNLNEYDKVKISHKRSSSSKYLDGRICSITNIDLNRSFLNVYEENLDYGNGIWFDEVEKVEDVYFEKINNNLNSDANYIDDLKNYVYTKFVVAKEKISDLQISTICYLCLKYNLDDKQKDHIINKILNCETDEQIIKERYEIGVKLSNINQLINDFYKK